MDPGITAALATGFAAYARHVVPMGAVGTRLTAIFAIAGLALVHVVGVRPGTRMLAALALLKIVLIAGLVVAAFGSQAGDWAHFLPLIERHPMAPPFAGAFAGAFVAAFFSFGGWWEVTKIAGEVADPVHTLPRALWVGLFTVTLLYLGTTLAFIYVVPIDAVVPGEAFGAQVGGVILGAGGDTAIAAIVMVCVLGSLAAILMMAPRLYFAMAKDGLFPAAAAAVHPSFGTPARSIVMQATLASILVAVGTFDSIVSYFVFITVAFIALTVTSVFRLKREQPAWHVPGYPWTPVIFLLMVGVLLVLMAVNSPRQALLGTAIVVLGLPVYRLIARGDLIQTP
jgi:APA family basic amino acid/polyamine antiporter